MLAWIHSRPLHIHSHIIHLRNFTNLIQCDALSDLFRFDVTPYLSMTYNLTCNLLALKNLSCQKQKIANKFANSQPHGTQRLTIQSRYFTFLSIHVFIDTSTICINPYPSTTYDKIPNWDIRTYGNCSHFLRLEFLNTHRVSIHETTFPRHRIGKMETFHFP